jgi:uncharacterized DUF497 family protein
LKFEVNFEWDPHKNELNIEKHGISFVAALEIFSDSKRLESDTTRPE